MRAWAAACLLTATASASLIVPVASKARPPSADEERVGLVGRLLALDEDESLDVDTLERMGHLEHDRSLRRLLEVAQAPMSPLARLTWTRSVARQLQRNELTEHDREQLVVALLGQLRSGLGSNAPSAAAWTSEGDLSGSTQQLGFALADATALYALARSGHERALRQLVAWAALDGHPFPKSVTSIVAGHSLGALCRFRPTPEQLAHLRPPIGAAPMQRVATCLPQAPPGVQERLLEGPASLFAGADQDRLLELEWASRWAAEGDLPASYRRPSSWEFELPQHSPELRAWKLRLATILVSQGALPTSVQDAALKQAQVDLSSGNELARSAAAFALAVLEPTSVLPLLGSLDQPIQASLQRQSWFGPLAAARPVDQPGVHWMSPTTWSARSTSSWRASGLSTRGFDAASGNLWLSPWVARMRAEPAAGPAPSFDRVAALLTRGNDDERAAVAWGLGFVGAAQRPRARGILLTAYQTEVTPAVRRSICGALGNVGGLPESVVAAFAVDPLPVCRSLALPDETLGRFVALAWSRKPRHPTFVGVGARLPLRPAPDGLVISVGPEPEHGCASVDSNPGR